MANDQAADALRETLVSESVEDVNGRPANVVDGLAMIALALRRAASDLGLNEAATSMGAIEAHSAAVLEAGQAIASAIFDLAEAIREHSN